MQNSPVIYLIDNYDSFTYNLYQFIGEILETAQAQGKISNFKVIVKRNDKVSLEDISSNKPDKIIISPGAGSPEDPAYFGICSQVIKQLGKDIPLLGVCLGMQGIVNSFNGKITQAKVPVHGKTSVISHNGRGLFEAIPNQLQVMRYHSLIASANSIPECLEITALVDESAIGFNPSLANNIDMEIMALQHKKHPIYGIQFHPESFATEGGCEVIKNFLFL